MKMKKLLSMVMILCLALSVMSSLTVFAVWEDTVTLFETDFENETAGEAPRTVNGTNVIATTTDAEVLQGEEGSENTSKYTNVKGNQKVRMWFNEAVSEGTIVAEFDLNAGLYGNVYLGVLYEETPTTYAKYPFVLSGKVIKGNTVTGITGTDMTNFTRKADNAEEMQITNDSWHHYKVKMDLTAGSVTVWVDGVESNAISGYEYFTEAIGGMAFYVNKSESKTWIDNIKIYKEACYGNYYLDNDFEKDLTGVVKNDENILQTYITEASSTNPSITNVTKYLTFENAASGNVAKIMFPTDTSTSSPKEITTGKFYVEFDIMTGFGGLCLSVVDNEDTSDSYKYKCIMGSGTKNSNPARFIGVYKTTATLPPSSTNKTAFVQSGTETKMALAENQWQHIKLEVDMDNESVKCTLDGVESDVIGGIEYLDKVSGIAFRWANGGGTIGENFEGAVDNIKVYTTSDGNSINDLKSGSDKIRVTLKDTIEAITLADIKVTTAIGEEVAVSDVELDTDKKNIFVTLASVPEEGTNYIVTLADSLKYSDGYDIVTKTKAFSYTKGTFSAVPEFVTKIFTKDGIATAKCTIGAYDFSNKSVKLYIASYNNGILKDVNVKDVSVDYKTYGEIVENVELTLTSDSTLLKAFVWDNSLIPYQTEAEASSDAQE